MNKIEKGELKNNLKYVVATGLITVFISNLVGLIMPLCLMYDAYAEYKIYTTYIAFSGLFHFGLINGVYLKFGKLSYDELPKEKFRAITTVLVLLQLIVSVVVMLFTQCMDATYRLSYFFVALNIPLININCYFSLVSQFTKRFKTDSLVQWVQSVLWIVFIIGLAWGCFDNCKIILLQVLLINLGPLACYIITNRSIVFGHRNSIRAILPEIKGFVHEGKHVMLSELIGLILINVDLIFVQHLFGTYDFAIYAFAVSIINAVYALMTYINGICYPYLVREKHTNQVNEKLHGIMLDLGVVLLASYYVLEFLLSLFFENYTDSIPIIKVLYITILMKMLIMGVYNNVCKIQNKNNTFLKINIFVLVISIVLNGVAYICDGSVISIGVASAVSAIIWLVAVERFITIKVSYLTTWIRIIIAVVAFMILDENVVLATGLYLIINIIVKLLVNYVSVKVH